MVLVDGLPGESATKTAISNALGDDKLAELAKQQRDGHGPWSHTDMRLAAIEDLLKWVIFAVYASQGGKPEKPEPTPRPGVATKRRRALTVEGHAHLRKLREEHATLHRYDPDTGAPLDGQVQETG